MEKRTRGLEENAESLVKIDVAPDLEWVSAFSLSEPFCHQKYGNNLRGVEG